MKMIVWILSALVVGVGGVCEASILNQTTFENNQKTPWELFVTSNGTVGEAGWPKVVMFGTVDEKQPSKSLIFKVGQIRYDPENTPNQGGGLRLQLSTDTGTILLSAYVAVAYQSPKDKRNLAGGLFEWLVDDQVVVRHDMGPIKNNGTLRHHLQAEHLVKAGTHTVHLRITRPFTSHPRQHAPFQYVDDLLIQHFPHP